MTRIWQHLKSTLCRWPARLPPRGACRWSGSAACSPRLTDWISDWSIDWNASGWSWPSSRGWPRSSSRVWRWACAPRWSWTAPPSSPSCLLSTQVTSPTSRSASSCLPQRYLGEVDRWAGDFQVERPCTILATMLCHDCPSAGSNCLILTGENAAEGNPVAQRLDSVVAYTSWWQCYMSNLALNRSTPFAR